VSAPSASTGQAAAGAVLRFRDAALSFGDRTLWSGLDLTVQPGEFLAVLGPNGTGKSSLLKTVLGQQPLSVGSVEVFGRPATAGDARIGYVPQQRPLDAGTPLRAKDMVAFGLNGHRWGLPLSSAATRRRVGELLAAVGATAFADSPVASLSGGEQQRVRVAQSVAANPRLLLCDEPLLSLDISQQREISELLDSVRRDTGAAVVFVTHDVNPILGMVDRVLYLAGGRFQIGTPDQVLRSEVLSAMYETPVEVLRRNGRILVVGLPDGEGVDDAHHHADGVLP
jgi:zinc/manganese transport system ATP-binding protein